MSIKTKIKKVGAAAAGTLLVGATLGAAVSLADYPSPFMDNSNVNSQLVVGSQGENPAGLASDIVGGINVAASLGSQTVQTEEKNITVTAGGTEKERVKGKEYSSLIRSGEIQPANEWIDASDFSKLKRETVEDSDGDEHYVVEKIGIDPMNQNAKDVGTVVNNESEVLATVEPESVKYQVSYTPGFEVEETVSILGNEYEITEITENSDGDKVVKMGSKIEQDDLNTGDSYEHGPYLVYITDVSLDQSEIYVKVTKEGSLVKSKPMEEGEELTINDGKFSVTVDSIFVGTDTSYFDLKSVYTDTEITEGEETPFDESYTVESIEGGNFTSDFPEKGVVTELTFSNKVYTSEDPTGTDTEEDTQRLSSGDKLAGPAGYFNVVFTGLSEEEKENIKVKDGYEVIYNDVEGFEHTINASKVIQANNPVEITDTQIEYTDIKGHPVKVDLVNNPATTGIEDEATLSYKGWSVTLDENKQSVNQDTGYGFTVEASLSDGVGGEDEITIQTSDRVLNTQFDKGVKFLHNEEVAGSEDSAGAAIQIDENKDGAFNVLNTDGVDIEVNYDGTGDTDQVATSQGGVMDFTEESKKSLTNFGTEVHVTSDMSPVNLKVPEKRLDTNFVLGERKVEEVGGETITKSYTAVTDMGEAPELGMVDSGVTNSVKATENLILIGGPAVNSLTQELASQEDSSVWNLTTWRDGNHTNKAQIAMVEDAFTEGKAALVVAGHDSEDTRVATEILSDFKDNKDMFKNKEITISKSENPGLWD